MIRNRLLSRFIKEQFKHLSTSSHFNGYHLKPPWKILFFGTDDFSLASLKALHNEYRKGDLLSKLEVVTSIKNKKNAVLKYASQEKLVVHNWPICPPECRGFHAGFVVSFGHLIPGDIISAFPLGMVNVHASLLPRWRGAAPIIYALANGDKATGITVMKIKAEKFDVGEIIAQSSVEISDEMKMPELYSKLATLGADALIRILVDLPRNVNNAIAQPEEGVTFAPRVDSKIAHINWQSMSAREVCNLERALTGLFHLTTRFNGGFIKLFDVSESQTVNLKQFDINLNENTNQIVPGRFIYDKRLKAIKVQCSDGQWIAVKGIGVPGKKMSATDFNNGFVSKQNEKILVFR